MLRRATFRFAAAAAAAAPEDQKMVTLHKLLTAIV